MKLGWKQAQLGDLAHFDRGLTYAKKDEVDFSSSVVLRANNITLGTNQLNFDEMRYISDSIEIPSNKRVRDGSILICTASGSKSHLGKAAIISGGINYAFGGFMGLITPNEQILSRYLYYFFLSQEYRSHITNLTDGTNINNLKWNQLSSFNVPLPPLEEQRRIVAILDEAFEGLETAQANAKANLASAEEMFRSHLNATFPNVVETNENALKEGWELKKLSEICEILNSLRIPITKSKRAAGPYPYYGASGIVDYVKDFIFDEELLLVSEDGANLIARTYPIAFRVSGKCWVNNHAHVLKFEDQQLSRYVELYLNSISVEQWVSGAAQPKLNQAKLREITVPLPPIQEMVRIMAITDKIQSQIDHLKKDMNHKLSQIRELKQSLLQKAFAGELT